ncbi:hypothetical protein [Streptomyces roseoviridis]|uniref:Uncharacterized protein n=1 Tax=Streptomyces roseoviridis TaxID=67361 RepID=A0ABV5R188_9ACTN
MSTWFGLAALLLYLAGVGALAHVWPYAARRHPWLQLANDTNPVFVSLYLALITVAWPGLPLAAALIHLARRTR